LSPARVPGESFLAFTQQIETLEQGIDPIFVPAALTQWGWPHSFNQFINSVRTNIGARSMI
jgi:hypothetical protein